MLKIQKPLAIPQNMVYNNNIVLVIRLYLIYLRSMHRLDLCGVALRQDLFFISILMANQYNIQFLTGDADHEHFAIIKKMFSGFLRNFCTKNQIMKLAVC